MVMIVLDEGELCKYRSCRTKRALCDTTSASWVSSRLLSQPPFWPSCHKFSFPHGSNLGQRQVLGVGRFGTVEAWQCLRPHELSRRVDSELFDSTYFDLGGEGSLVKLFSNHAGRRKGKYLSGSGTQASHTR
jgi:hypothetical protein